MSTFRNDCPNGHGKMVMKKMINTANFRGESVRYEKECYVCPVCGLTACTVEQAAAIQKAILNAYRMSRSGDELLPAAA